MRVHGRLKLPMRRRSGSAPPHSSVLPLNRVLRGPAVRPSSISLSVCPYGCYHPSRAMRCFVSLSRFFMPSSPFAPHAVPHSAPAQVLHPSLMSLTPFPTYADMFPSLAALPCSFRSFSPPLFDPSASPSPPISPIPHGRRPRSPAPIHSPWPISFQSTSFLWDPPLSSIPPVL